MSDVRGIHLDSPVLVEAAAMLEELGWGGQILDHRWRSVYRSSEWYRGLPDAFENIASDLDPTLDLTPLAGGDRWEKAGVRSEPPIVPALLAAMRYDISPTDSDFDTAFGSKADLARRTDPPDAPPHFIAHRTSISVDNGPPERRTVGYLRLTDDAGDFVGVLVLPRMPLSSGVQAVMLRGSPEMYERMDRFREPARRSAAILFADVDQSGVLSRTLPSRTYFELIRSLTDLIDTEVDRHGGIVGKHAGDGASALFIVDGEVSESMAARAAIETARAISTGLDQVPEVATVQLNIGLHWGSTMTIGQISTRGRLEVTALGDEMNEGARIEQAATGGTSLASKQLIERLAPDDAAHLDLDPESIQYRTIAELEPSAKALRDAGTIAVAKI